MNATPQFIGALTELVWTQIEGVAGDLESFARSEWYLDQEWFKLVDAKASIDMQVAKPSQWTTSCCCHAGMRD